MRRVLVVYALAVVLSSSPAIASPIQYSLTGFLGSGSSLTKADGTTVDLSSAAFTVTGVTTGLDSFALLPSGTWVPAFTATSTWDFGALGSFTTNEGADSYVEIYGIGAQGRQLTAVGIVTWSPSRASDQGFYVYFDPISAPEASTPPQPFAAGPLANIVTVPYKTRVGTNSAGEVFQQSNPPLEGSSKLHITSGEITPTPEPATLALLAVGAVVLSRSRRRHG